MQRFERENLHLLIPWTVRLATSRGLRFENDISGDEELTSLSVQRSVVRNPFISAKIALVSDHLNSWRLDVATYDHR
jgi:hypothetical protein